MDKKYSRKQFLKLAPLSIQNFLYGEEATESDENNNPIVLRPPGAVQPETLFLKLCSRCLKCADACPHNAIDFPGMSEGILENTPVLHPTEKPCQWCKDFPCIAACPTGALAVKPNMSPSIIGIAKIDRDKCSVSQGMICEICKNACPSSIKAITTGPDRHPVLDEGKCTGCGLCSYYCDMEPVAIEILKAEY